MGFMDKAKKMAEQAQEKLDEVQQQFSEARRAASSSRSSRSSPARPEFATTSTAGQSRRRGRPLVRHHRLPRSRRPSSPRPRRPPRRSSRLHLRPRASRAIPTLQAGRMTISGVLTAMVTPFDADGALNEEAAAGLMHHLLENGSDGLVLAGSTGRA